MFIWFTYQDNDGFINKSLGAFLPFLQIRIIWEVLMLLLWRYDKILQWINLATSYFHICCTVSFFIFNFINLDLLLVNGLSILFISSNNQLFISLIANIRFFSIFFNISSSFNYFWPSTTLEFGLFLSFSIALSIIELDIWAL